MGTQLPPQKRHSPKFSAHMHCGQTAGWIKMPLGTEVGLRHYTKITWRYWDRKLPCTQTGSRISDTPNITLTRWLLPCCASSWSNALKPTQELPYIQHHQAKCLVNKNTSLLFTSLVISSLSPLTPLKLPSPPSPCSPFLPLSVSSTLLKIFSWNKDTRKQVDTHLQLYIQRTHEKTPPQV